MPHQDLNLEPDSGQQLDATTLPNRPSKNTQKHSIKRWLPAISMAIGFHVVLAALLLSRYSPLSPQQTSSATQSDAANFVPINAVDNDDDTVTVLKTHSHVVIKNEPNHVESSTTTATETNNAVVSNDMHQPNLSSSQNITHTNNQHITTESMTNLAQENMTINDHINHTPANLDKKSNLNANNTQASNDMTNTAYSTDEQQTQEQIDKINARHAAQQQAIKDEQLLSIDLPSNVQQQNQELLSDVNLRDKTDRETEKQVQQIKAQLSDANAKMSEQLEQIRQLTQQQIEQDRAGRQAMSK